MVRIEILTCMMLLNVLIGGLLFGVTVMPVKGIKEVALKNDVLTLSQNRYSVGKHPPYAINMPHCTVDHVWRVRGLSFHVQSVLGLSAESASKDSRWCPLWCRPCGHLTTRNWTGTPKFPSHKSLNDHQMRTSLPP